MRKMQLYGLYNIRTKKRVSRKKLAEDLGLTVEYIKALETTNSETVGDNLIHMFAEYFDCSVYEILGNDEQEDLLEKKITLEKIEIPDGVSPMEANHLLFDLLKKYSPIGQNNIDTLISEFKYRLGDLGEKDKSNNLINRLMRSEFELDDEDDWEEESDYGDPIELIPELVQKIRKDAATAATFYKELRAQGLDREDALLILKTIMN